MSKQPVLDNVSNVLNSETTLNQNNDNIKEAFDNTLSRDGSTPNQMEADLDMNSRNITNINNASMNTITVAGTTLVPNDAASIPDWKGGWTTSTSYVVNDLVREDGNSYICIEAHTSGTFSTDLSMNKWELFASKGTAGAGTGDMIGSNNLNDVADAPTARSNLGLGTIATLSEIAISNIASGNKSGNDTTLITGTSGTLGNLSEWNNDGDLVDGPDYGTGTNDLLQLDANGKIPASVSYSSVGPTSLNTLGEVTFSIPSWVNKIELLMEKLSISSGNENYLVQLSTSSTYKTTGYDSLSQGSSASSLINSTSGFIMRQSSASSNWNGVMTLFRIPGNTKWVSTHILENQKGTGCVDVGGTLDGLKLKIDGIRTFDNGTASVLLYP